jgi:hypothetical protein
LGQGGGRYLLLGPVSVALKDWYFIFVKGWSEVSELVAGRLDNAFYVLRVIIE